MRTASQLAKQIRRGLRLRERDIAEPAAHEWAERIERGPVRSCVPKKKQRAAGMLPSVRVPV